MFLCNECGGVFEQPKTGYDVYLEHFGHPCREEFDACPLCGADNIVRAVRCIACGFYVQADKAEEGFCSACALSVVKRFGAFSDTLTKAEKDLLNARFYGVDVFV